MNRLKITKTRKINKEENVLLLIKNISGYKGDLLRSDEISYIKKQAKEYKKESYLFNRLSHLVFVYLPKEEENDSKKHEKCRTEGDKVCGLINQNKKTSLSIINVDFSLSEVLAVAEGISLGNYQFIKYHTKKEEKENHLKQLNICVEEVEQTSIDELALITDACYFCRDLVNEPLNSLNATELSERVNKEATAAGAKVEIFTKKKIESLKMGGLLAVNKGSVDPPTFTIIEWKPDDAINKKPLILVGKGVVFDTGGMNIKPGTYLDNMKSDMAGAATMAATCIAAARAKLPYHIITLLPATDNRPDGNAYVPDDIIKMHNGMTVEIRNTDAEGRLILADALSYAQKYNPELVITAATLTGAASRAIGKYGIVAMQTKANEDIQKLKEAGETVYERLVEFPFWEEYGELLKSEVADLKNLGGSDAGMITAGKFLENFTSYPFIHLDIAGPAFYDKKDAYRPAGGTAFGVRALFTFLKNKALQ